MAQIPAATYDGDLGEGAPIKLNIGNGGAGQSGLIKGIGSSTFLRTGTDLDSIGRSVYKGLYRKWLCTIPSRLVDK